MAIPRKWTAERDAMLKDGVAQRMSFEDIAAKINKATGSDFGRGGVAGRVNRIGLSIPRVAAAPKPALPKRDSVATAFAKGAAQKIFAKVNGALAPIVPFEPKADPAYHQPLRLTFEELTRTSCRWPYGEAPPFRFCGCHVDIASPYCHEHTKLSYQKPTTPEERLRRQKHGEMIARMGRKATHAARASA